MANGNGEVKKLEDALAKEKDSSSNVARSLRKKLRKLGVFRSKKQEVVEKKPVVEKKSVVKKVITTKPVKVNKVVTEDDDEEDVA